MPQRIKGNICAVRPYSRAADRSRNDHRAPGLFRAGSDVERVKPPEVLPGFLSDCGNIHGPGARVDDGCTRNSYLATNRTAADVLRRKRRDSRGGINKTSLPQRRAACGIGVKCVDAIVLRHNKNDVVRALPRDQEVRHVKRLTVNGAIHGYGKELAELNRIHIARCQDRFLQVLAGPEIIVVLSKHSARVGHVNLSYTLQTGIRLADSSDRVTPDQGGRGIEPGRGKDPHLGVAALNTIYRPSHIIVGNVGPSGLKLLGLVES